MLLLAKILPRLESRNAGSLASLPQLARRPLLLGVYGMTILMVVAHFTAYSYIEPYVLRVTQMPPQTATAVLLVYGVSGMAASWLFSRFYPSRPNTTLLTAAGLLLFSLLLLNPLGGSTAAMFALVFVWGIGIAVASLSVIGHVMRYAADATDVANAIFSGCCNIGIGGGALLGGIVMRHWGLGALGWTGAALAASALAVFGWTQLRFAEK